MKKPEAPPINKNNELSALTIDYILKNKLNELYKIERENYPYWEELKQRIKKWETPPEEVWHFLKNQRLFIRNVLQFSKIPNFIFRFSVPGLIQKDLHKLDMNLGGTLQSEYAIPPEEKNRYLISSIMEESIASSQLEGAVTTRKVAKEMLEQQRKPRNKSERMILNNYLTMKWIVENKDLVLKPATLLHMHKLMTMDTLDERDMEGAFRKTDDIKIMDENNEVFYDPPSYTYVKQLIEEFCAFANNEKEDNEFIHPVIKGIILHFLIGYIHPFVDGNGRTARAIFYWYLIKKGYWLIEYMSVSRIILRAKSQYARAYLYTEYDENDLTYFILYNVKAVLTSLEELKNYLQKKIEEKRKIISLLKTGGFNDRQIVLIKDLLADRERYFTVKQIETRFDVSNQTARNDLVGLTEKGVLEQKISGKRSQFFASENFEKTLRVK